MISIIHPSRGRPEKSLDTIRKWGKAMARCNGELCEVIVSCDRDDFALNTYVRLHGDKVLINDNRSAVDAINNAAKVSRGNIIIVVSDDTETVEDWNHKIEDVTAGKNDFIIKTQDGIQPWIITMPIMDRAYYNRFGYIYHPDYQHMFCDTELTCVADLTGRKLTSDILFKHNHYSVTKEQPDAVNKKADATWAQGEKLFLERYKRNFDLKPEDIKGKIQDNGMINWLQNKVR